MTSTEIKLGMSANARPSSRVLKPPGGGHSNIFAEPEISVNAPRPKYNQQNSSNLNACIGSTDPNQVVEKLREEIAKEHETKVEKTDEQKEAAANNNPKNNGAGNGQGNAPRGRVPPGGYSSGGFW